jgi:hypothetical protein
VVTLKATLIVLPRVALNNVQDLGHKLNVVHGVPSY